MNLKNYKYGNTEFVIDISTIQAIVKNGQGRTVTIVFVNKDDPLRITFDSYREREKFYEDILKDIEELNKPPVNTFSLGIDLSRSVDS